MKLLFAILMTLITSVILYFTLQNDTVKELLDNRVNIVEPLTVNTGVKTNNKPKPNRNDSVTPATVTVNALWQNSTDAVQKKYPYKTNSDLHHQYVSLNRKKLDALKVNDEIALYIPQSNREYTVAIKAITTTDNNDTTYIGHLIDYGSSSRLVMTTNISSTFASIYTVDGTFILRGYKNDAWIYDEKEVINTIDYSKTDIRMD